jgi:acylphosphatase
MTLCLISKFIDAHPAGVTRSAQFPPRFPGASATIARLQPGNGSWILAVETLAKRFYVSGAVQGVGFRFFTEDVALRIRIAGYVRNLFDGRVEIYAVGSATQLDALKLELQRGPRMAHVEQVVEIDAEIIAEYARSFSVERDH